MIIDLELDHSTSIATLYRHEVDCRQVRQSGHCPQCRLRQAAGENREHTSIKLYRLFVEPHCNTSFHFKWEWEVVLTVKLVFKQSRAPPLNWSWSLAPKWPIRQRLRVYWRSNKNRQSCTLKICSRHRRLTIFYVSVLSWISSAMPRFWMIRCCYARFWRASKCPLPIMSSGHTCAIRSSGKTRIKLQSLSIWTVGSGTLAIWMRSRNEHV